MLINHHHDLNTVSSWLLTVWPSPTTHWTLFVAFAVGYNNYSIKFLAIVLRLLLGWLILSLVLLRSNRLFVFGATLLISLDGIIINEKQ